MRIYEKRPLTEDERRTVAENLGLIGLARRRFRRLFSLVGQDAEGIGAVALCLAVQRHTVSKGELSTYALKTIRGMWMDSINRSERKKWEANRGVAFDSLGDFEPLADSFQPSLEFDEVEAIHSAIEALSAPRAASVKACLMLGLSCAEHAANIGISADAVKQTRRAGIRKLQELLKRED